LASYGTIRVEVERIAPSGKRDFDETVHSAVEVMLRL
jgi:hypothetical protein